MAASFPSAIKTFSTITNGVTKLVAALFNSPNDEITAIETQLGVNMAGVRIGAADDTKSTGTAYEATTDGFVVGAIYYTSGSDASFKTDSANPPTTSRGYFTAGAATNLYAGFTMPVKKGDYWLVTVTGTATVGIVWVPLGA